MTLASALSSQEIISQLGLAPLPVEGGYFTETYRAAGAGRPLATAIYYLRTDDPDSFSAMHRLPTDEIYHFYLGDPVEMLLLEPGGRGQVVVLGPDLLAGQRPQIVVPAGIWQGGRVISGGKWNLCGTTMAPGFAPSDYEGGKRAALIAQYPGYEALIRALTRPGAQAHMPGGDVYA